MYVGVGIGCFLVGALCMVLAGRRSKELKAAQEGDGKKSGQVVVWFRVLGWILWLVGILALVLYVIVWNGMLTLPLDRG